MNDTTTTARTAADSVARLVLLPGDEEMNWNDALAWAEKQGGRLPSRIDALVLWQNLKPHFKAEYYWTREPSAGDESYAWIQGFDGGAQGNGHKSDGSRARAVRSVIL